MILKITPNPFKTLSLIFAFSLFLTSGEVKAQTRVYANSATVSNATHVDNPTNAYDGNVTTLANVRANSGVALGIGAYNGYIELQFPSTLPANTTSFVKIQTEDDLLNSLLGGTLGGLLADVLGVVLTGSQEFTVQAKNGSTVVLQGDSQDGGEFATARMRIVTDAAGDFYVMVTPAQSYNRIRITNRTGGALVGLGNEKDLFVYDAFYIQDPANCGTPAYTSFSASGINLDLIDLANYGVQNPENAIDSDPDNFSTLSFGVLGIAAAVEQTVYFEGSSTADDEFMIRLRLAQTLLDLNVANSINVRSYNGATLVQEVTLSTLLTLNLLSLDGGEIESIPLAPGAPVNRITIEFESLIGASVLQNLDFFGIVRTAAAPEITDLETLNALACEGGTADLIADTDPANELRWYDAAEGGNLLATVPAGSAFTTPVLTTDTTFYVAARRIGCPEESARVAVEVEVDIVATPTGPASQQFCAFEGATVADLEVNEAGVVFYDAATAGNQYQETDLLTAGTYYAALVNSITGCESATRLAITVGLADFCDVTLNVKVMLQGALLNSTGGLMRDNLRTQGLIPLEQPYSAVLDERFTHYNGGGSETTTSTVLNANAGTGDAIVDWVFVEIRDQATPQTVFKTVSALLQRDGDIVASDGGPLTVAGLPEMFYIAVKHRNHFGAMGANVLTVVNSEVTLDFTTIDNAGLFSISGSSPELAMVTVGGIKAFYMGNANFDSRVKYDGAANDRQFAASQVLSHPSNSNQTLNFSSATGYSSGDINMDGKVLYDGGGNDRILIQNTVITYPLNTSGLNNFNGMIEQLPQ